MEVQLREIQTSEEAFLQEMLFTAIFVPEGQSPFPKTILNVPEIFRYIEDWGAFSDDMAFVAVCNDELVGAIWGRKFERSNPGYGFVDEHTPEIVIAVKASFRNQGIGSKLIDALSRYYFSKGVAFISLSVDKRNPCRFLYKRKGFVLVEEGDTDLVMKKQLR